MPQPSPSERIEEEAASWAARLRGGNLGDDRLAALAAWLAADPEHRRVFGRYRELSAQLDAQLGRAAESITAPRIAARRHRWQVATAALTVAAVTAIIFVMSPGRAREFDTKIGERHVAVLADGSKVELNAQTSLVVDFAPAERRVRLSRGEALFTVAKDSARPFIVETPQGSVRVTGTVFNVCVSGSEQVEVTVLEGTVRLRPANLSAGEEAVTPDRQAVMADEHIVVRTLPAGTAQNIVAWRQGQAVFDDTRLEDAIARFAIYQTGTITVDPDVAELRLGGRYHLDDLDGFLKSVERVLPIRVLHGADDAVRIAAK